MSIYSFRTKDHPEANGRRPQNGEQAWTIDFTLEDGGKLYVKMGKVGRQALKDMLAQEEADDAAESAGLPLPPSDLRRDA